MALRSGAPVIPCTIVGAEESHWNLGSVKLPLMKGGLRVPLPLNLFPLPAKWRIRFRKPVRFEEPGLRGADKKRWVDARTKEMQARMQRLLLLEKRQRGGPFLSRRSGAVAGSRAPTIRHLRKPHANE
jgi:1-acyl-sn-glycerol-3-phosphate acyltransferase